MSWANGEPIDSGVKHGASGFSQLNSEGKCSCTTTLRVWRKVEEKGERHYVPSADGVSGWLQPQRGSGFETDPCTW